MIGNFNLTKDEIIHVLVGQKGNRGNNSQKTAGGGGGTFVVRGNNTPLVIAGGGGGIRKLSEQHPTCDASLHKHHRKCRMQIAVGFRRRRRTWRKKQKSTFG